MNYGVLFKRLLMLVWDQIRAHKTKSTKKLLMNTELAVISGGLTSQLHPLNVSINKPFNNFMQEEWKKWIAKPRCYSNRMYEMVNNFRSTYLGEKFMGSCERSDYKVI